MGLKCPSTLSMALFFFNQVSDNVKIKSKQILLLHECFESIIPDLLKSDPGLDYDL